MRKNNPIAHPNEPRPARTMRDGTYRTQVSVLFIIEASNGLFYGTTYQRGTGMQSTGTIYSVSPDGAYTLGHSFDPDQIKSP